MPGLKLRSRFLLRCSVRDARAEPKENEGAGRHGAASVLPVHVSLEGSPPPPELFVKAFIRKDFSGEET